MNTTATLSYSDLLDSLTCVAVIGNLMGVALSWYLVHALGPSVARWKNSDSHYKLRLILCIATCVNRTSHFIRTFLMIELVRMHMTSTHVVQKYGLGAIVLTWIVNLLRVLWSMTVFSIFIIVLLLTYDRFARVTLVLAGSQWDRLFRYMRWVLLTMSCFVIVVTAIVYIHHSLSFQQGLDLPDFYVALDTIGVLAGCGVGMLCALIELYLLLKLVQSSLRMNHDIHEGLDNDTASIALTIITTRKQRLKLKMILSMFALLFIDAATLLLIIIPFITEYHHHVFYSRSFMAKDHYMNIASVWLVARIWIMFQLLDDFVSGLRTFRHIRHDIPIVHTLKEESRDVSANSKLHPSVGMQRANNTRDQDVEMTDIATSENVSSFVPYSWLKRRDVH